MKKIRWWSDAGFVGTSRSGVIEVDDDATEEEMEEAARDMVFNFFEWGYGPAEDGDEREE